MEHKSEVAKVQALTKVDKTRVEFCWKIEHFSFCAKKQEILESSTFGSSLKWRVRLYTRGINEKYSRYMGIFLVLVQDKSLNKNLTKEVFYNFSILNGEHQRVSLVRSRESRQFQKESDSWGFPKFLSRSMIETDRNDLLPNDQLTILVEMAIFGLISTVEEKTEVDQVSPVQMKLKTKSKDRQPKPQEQIGSTKKTEIETLSRKKNFVNYFLNNQYSDMMLVSSDGKEFPVHRILLANESPVFQHKFDSNQSTNKLELKQFDSQTLTDILSFIYTGSLEFKSTSDNLLNFVDAYQMNGLKSYFEKEMIDKISILNAPKYLRIAHQSNSINLKNEIMKFLKKNLHQVTETEEWKRLLETDPVLTSEVYRQVLIDK